MQRSPDILRYRTLIFIVSAILIVAGGALIFTSGSDTPGQSAASPGQPNDTDPQVIGSVGLPATSTAPSIPTSGPSTTPVAGRTPTHPRTIQLTPTGPVATPTQPPNDSPGPHLSIPTIAVYAHVETRSTDANNVMQTPNDPFNVAWYDFTATPGTVGNAVFAGHVDHVDVGRSVFWSLSQLQPGDEISYVALDGQSFRYRVSRTATAWSNDAANQYVAPTSTEIVTLITCIGNFDRSTLSYDQRLIVQAERIP